MAYEFRKLSAEDSGLGEALDVMRAAFSGMEGRIDPPSSLSEMSVESLAQTAATSEIWVTGSPVIGTVILTPKSKVLHVGKLAVRDQRRGLGRALMGLAQERAVVLGFSWLELESRVELVEVHAVFKVLGFREVGRTTHAGYTRPTLILFRKAIA